MGLSRCCRPAWPDRARCIQGRWPDDPGHPAEGDRGGGVSGRLTSSPARCPWRARRRRRASSTRCRDETSCSPCLPTAARGGACGACARLPNRASYCATQAPAISAEGGPPASRGKRCTASSTHAGCNAHDGVDESRVAELTPWSTRATRCRYPATEKKGAAFDEARPAPAPGSSGCTLAVS